MIVAVLGLTLVVWRPAHVAVQTLTLLPRLFPSAPIDPLTAITAAPARETRSYHYAGGDVEADLYLPAQSDGVRNGALILLLGAGDLPRSDLAQRFADGLARTGLVVLIPETTGMRYERLSFDEVDAIRKSIVILGDVPSVDVSRVGIVGLSASGGLSIVAAGQPDLRDRVRLVDSFGSYSSATTLLIDVASRSLESDGAERTWQPEPRTVEVVGTALADAGFSPEARAELLAGTTRARARHLIAQAGPEAGRRLAQVSPSTWLSMVHAHVYLMHDRDDAFIPFTESRDLVAEAPPGVIARYTEFSIFAHVIPDRQVPWQTFVPDLWRLYWHVHAVLADVL